MRNRVIKVTEQQLKETEGEAYKYLSQNNEYPTCNGNSEISVSGNIDAETPGEPVIGDKVAATMTPQGVYRYRGCTNQYAVSMRESAALDRVDKKNPELDTLADGDNKNDTTKVPQMTIKRLNMLVDNMRRLRPKQLAMVLNKIIESFDLSQIPLSWRKDLIAKLNIMSNGSENTIN